MTGPLALIVLDGWGIRADREANAHAGRECVEERFQNQVDPLDQPSCVNRGVRCPERPLEIVDDR